MKGRVVGRTYRINGVLYVATRQLELTVVPREDQPPLTSEERLILTNAVSFLAPYRDSVQNLHKNSTELLRFRVSDASARMQDAAEFIRSVANRADGRLLEVGQDVCCDLYQSELEVVEDLP